MMTGFHLQVFFLIFIYLPALCSGGLSAGLEIRGHQKLNALTRNAALHKHPLGYSGAQGSQRNLAWDSQTPLR